MSTISKKHNYDRVFIKEISYDHLQSGASSPYIILESKIPYYEVVTLTLPNCNSYESHMKKTRTKFLWKFENLLKITCRENSFMNASQTTIYNCINDAVHRTTRIANNWHILVENRRWCYSSHYPRLEDKFMNIIGTCTHRSDIYFDSMMLAIEDFIASHRAKSVRSISEIRHIECQKFVIRREQYP